MKRFLKSIPLVVPLVRTARNASANFKDYFLDRLFPQRVEAIFTSHYNRNYWGDEVSRSGAGSNLDSTAALRRELPGIFRKYNIETLVDAPCGDGSISFFGRAVKTLAFRK